MTWRVTSAIPTGWWGGARVGCAHGDEDRNLGTISEGTSVIAETWPWDNGSSSSSTALWVAGLAKQNRDVGGGQRSGFDFAYTHCSWMKQAAERLWGNATVMPWKVLTWGLSCRVKEGRMCLFF